MNEILKKVHDIGVIPVVAIDDPGKAVPLARALEKGGLPAAEITFRTAAAEEAMRAIAEEVPEMLLAAGTVLTLEQAEKAIAAGAKMIVSPGLNPEIVEYVLSRNITMLPGAVTAGEMGQAMSYGLTAVKFFPAEQNGGAEMLKALAGPYKTLHWMPTGGINGKNLGEYMRFSGTLACGGTWMVKTELIEAEHWDRITELSREAVKIMNGFTLKHIGMNCGSSEETEKAAKLFAGMFDLDYKAGNSSDFAGSMAEFCETPGHGKNGHIAVGTNDVDRAVFHLERNHVMFDKDTEKKDEKGIKSIYLQDEICGFAVHLVRN